MASKISRDISIIRGSAYYLTAIAVKQVTVFGFVPPWLLSYNLVAVLQNRNTTRSSSLQTELPAPLCTAQRGTVWMHVRLSGMKVEESLTCSLVHFIRQTHMLTHTSNRHYYHTGWHTLMLLSTNVLKTTVMYRVMSNWNKTTSTVNSDHQWDMI